MPRLGDCGHKHTMTLTGMLRLFADNRCSLCLIWCVFLNFAVMKIFTAKQLRELDAYTMKSEPVESYDLMERAAVAMSKVIMRRFAGKRRYVVFAGPGNNGGDALAIARLLAEGGNEIDAYIFNIGSKISSDCEKNASRLNGMKSVNVTEITKQFEPMKLAESDIVIDGLFGTGLNKPLGGGFAGLVRYINSQPSYVVSIDVPSGLMCEDNSYNVRQNIVRANLTLTVELPKLSFFLADAACFVGESVVVPIGLSGEYKEKTSTPFSTIGASDVCGFLKRRNPFAHKGTFGHGLLVAGSYGMAGAAVLAGRACMRGGIGKLTIHTPACNKDIIQQSVVEAVLSIDSGTRFFSQAEEAAAYNAVAIGPGLGNFHDTDDAFIEQVRNCRAPLVIDADGLNILARHRGWLGQLPSKTILTPHPGEFMRLVDTEGDNYKMMAAARDMAMHYQVYVVLKGHHTLVNTPEGHTYINTSGNAGMATAGSGDVLTGILLSLLAQGYSPSEACQLGVCLHGLAGDCAEKAKGQESLVASDIIDYLPAAFKKLHEKAEE